MSYDECKKAILSNPQLQEISQKDEDINEILSIFERCPKTSDIIKQLKDLTHSYIFDDDFESEKYLKEQNEALELD